ncbi:hypothetical protein BGW42_001346 [Actinomortierella wolfii]|nr:hypothetical protein BGW42_001346 [Actinomortierella wolfii]
MEVMSNAKIQAEIQSLFKLRHNNLQQFYTDTHHDGQLALVAEDIDGCSLQETINRKRQLEWPDKKRIAEQMARGLEYLHDMNIVHGDLRSSKVLLTKEDMTVKLCDFGMPTVKDMILSRSPRSPESDAVRWMAPELLTATTPRMYSPKSDMYALAVVMWEMAADCTTPFQKYPTNKKVIAVVKNGWRDKLPSETPIKYRICVSLCWQNDPNKRPSAANLITMMQSSSSSYNDDSFSSGASNVTEMLQQLDINLPLRDRVGSRRITVSFSDSDSNYGEPSSGITPAAAAVASHTPAYMPVMEFRELLGRAEQGNTEAQVEVASKFKEGVAGVVKSDYLASVWYRRAAEQGHIDAQYQLGEYLHLGKGVVRCYTEAASWYLKAASQGHAEAQIALGWAYQYGLGVDKDEIESDYWYYRAALQGHAKAQDILAGQDRHYVASISRCRLAADSGNEQEQFNLGLMYKDGLGIKLDRVKAAQWLRRAADQGHSEAQFRLGMLFMEGGGGVEQSDAKALACFRESALQEQPEAQYHLATMYQTGLGTKRNVERAVFWYEKAANNGALLAQLRLAGMYYDGRGVEQNHKKAVYWYGKAAVQGVADAQFRLGEAYRSGRGT